MQGKRTERKVEKEWFGPDIELLEPIMTQARARAAVAALQCDVLSGLQPKGKQRPGYPFAYCIRCGYRFSTDDGLESCKCGARKPER